MRHEGEGEIKTYKKYGKVQAGEVPSQAALAHQRRLREDKRMAPTPVGFSKPAPQVRVMPKDD